MLGSGHCPHASKRNSLLCNCKCGTQASPNSESAILHATRCREGTGGKAPCVQMWLWLGGGEGQAVLPGSVISESGSVPLWLARSRLLGTVQMGQPQCPVPARGHAVSRPPQACGHLWAAWAVGSERCFRGQSRTSRTYAFPAWASVRAWAPLGTALGASRAGGCLRHGQLPGAHAGSCEGSKQVRVPRNEQQGQLSSSSSRYP